MASLKSIRKRITSVKNTQKVTRAMQMIAAARLRKAQVAAIGARSFAAHVKEIALRIADRTEQGIHPFLAHRDIPASTNVVEFLVLTSDRGLCGGFNENLLRRFMGQCRTQEEAGSMVHCTVIGRKGRDYCRAKGRSTREVLVGFYDGLSMEKILPLAESLATRFLEGTIHHLVLVYNRFRSAIAQDITAEALLPMAPQVVEAGLKVDYLYEPARDVVIDRLLTRALAARIYQALLESSASELAARMTAMDSATKNGSEMIQALTTQFNRARQAAITKDLMDIVNGAESIRA